MTLLILGLILWVAGHLWGRFVPDLYDRIGPASKGVSAIMIIASVVLMVIGYRAAAFIPVWNPPTFLTHVNNLLMLLAFYVYFQTATQLGTAWIMGHTRHPQLLGFKIWTVAHLLVNGDVASLLLFGGLLGWAVWEVILLNRAKSVGPDRATAPIKSPWVHLALSLAVFSVVAGIHVWLGVSPFGG